MDWNRYHAETANSYLNVQDKKVLVIGCNKGKDVSYFVDFGAQEVWGLDVVDEIGEEYSHARAKYLQNSAEQMDIEDNTFDLVYCFATMEHIPNIEQAFAEMVRVAKPEGIIYCVAAPLWNSRQGHHKSHIFDIDKYPWIHIRFSSEEIKSRCRKGEISYPGWVTDINAEIDYMTNKEYFNLRFAKDYIDTCNNLKGVSIIHNNLDLEKEYHLGLLSISEFKEIFERGINATELLAVTHTFIGRKRHHYQPNNFSDNLAEELEKTKKKLKRVKMRLRDAENVIQAMKSSKFWKLRGIWFALKKKIGLITDE